MDSHETSARPKSANIRRRTATATIQRATTSSFCLTADPSGNEDQVEEDLWSEKFTSPTQIGRLAKLEERDEDLESEFKTSNVLFSVAAETGRLPVDGSSHWSWSREQSFARSSPHLSRSLEEPTLAQPMFSRTQSQTSYDGLVMYECLQRSSALRVLSKAIDRHKDLAANGSEPLNLESHLGTTTHSVYLRRTPPRKLKPLFRGDSAN